MATRIRQIANWPICGTNAPGQKQCKPPTRVCEGEAANTRCGKPIGIGLACFAAVAAGVCRLPGDLNWRHVFGACLLGGIGFTMSIFIANLAFPDARETVDAAKMAILAASLISGALGYGWLRWSCKPVLCAAPPRDEA